jgi:phosphoribosylanthranilate isomerase
MTWIKVCGITNADDALAAVAAGANAIGFVFVEGSPRHISVETARGIASQLPAEIEKVGIFMNSAPEEIHATAQQVGLSAVQLHGNESLDSLRLLFKLLRNGEERPLMIRACPARLLEGSREEGKSWDPIAAGVVEVDETYGGKRVGRLHVADNGDLFLETHGFRPGVVSRVLLDSAAGSRRGGTGKRFDWQKVQPWASIINSISKLIVAGGLGPDNVSDAMRALHPWGVDVSSGVESAPGKKDAAKMRDFIEAVKAVADG